MKAIKPWRRAGNMTKGGSRIVASDVSLYKGGAFSTQQGEEELAWFEGGDCLFGIVGKKRKNTMKRRIFLGLLKE